jgi:hypothetical protein
MLIGIQNRMIIDPSNNGIELRILGVLCAFVLCGILVAGLWPFHAPRNAVTWSKNVNGLRFGNHGTVLSSGTLMTSGAQDEGISSLEVWLQPGRVDDANTVLAFYSPNNYWQFSLHQDHTDLRLQLESHQPHRIATSRMYVDDVFSKGKLVFLTITSSTAAGTSVYVDGALVKRSPSVRWSVVDFTGQLVFGTSAVVNDSWSGELRGLAIFNQELTTAQVLHHYETWTNLGGPGVTEKERAVALYLFDEHAGDVVHNQLSSGTNLHIPERYVILHEQFLEPPWKEFYAGWGYWKNVVINIGGFVPLGFFFNVYLSLIRKTRANTLATIILGATVSLTIEVGQAYLPTRNSGMTDLITNTLGTSLGVVLYRWNPALIRKSLSRIAALQFTRVLLLILAGKYLLSTRDR